MHDDLRWAARFAFLEELWRDRPRVVVDRGLEAWLSAGVAPDRDEDPVAALVDRLLPASAGGPRAFMATHEAATARELSRTRPATGFVPVDRLGDLLRHRDYQIAIVDLASVDVDADAETTAVAHSSATQVAAGRPALGPTARRVLELLGDAAEAGRAVAIVLPAGPGPGAFDEVQAMELLAERLGGGRLYGLYQPHMTALVDYGEPSDEGEPDEELDEELDEEPDEELDEEPDDDRETAALDDADDEADDTGGDEEVPLSFDNTLGTMTPAIAEWLLVAGVSAPADGLSLLEVREVAGAAAAPPATWRAQLSEAQRQADLRAIEVQRWVERADALAADNERLGTALAQAQDELARAVHAAAPGPEAAGLPGDLQAQARLESAAAEIQGLKWRIAQLEEELQAARARPLDEWEAEVASLRARLSAAEGDGASSVPEASAASNVTGARDRGAPAPASAFGGLGIGATQPSPGTHVQAAVRLLEELVHRIERGGIEAVKLRADLLELKTRLRRLPIGLPGSSVAATAPSGTGST